MRYVDDNWDSQRRLVRIDVVSKSVTAVELAQVLMERLFTELKFRGRQLIGAMRDGPSVNGAAIARLRDFMPNLVDVTCFSHMSDNVGKRFETPVLDEFGQHWVRLFSSSCKAKLLWAERTGCTPKSYSETRWWSRWEVYKRLLECFSKVRPFLDDNTAVAPKVTQHLRAMMDDEKQLQLLKLELAAIIDL